MENHHLQQQQQQQESKCLESILKDYCTVQEFFDSTWQREPKVFQYNYHNNINASPPNEIHSDVANGEWNDEIIMQNQKNPFHETIFQGWHVLTHLLHTTQQQQNHSANENRSFQPPQINNNNPSDVQQPLIFQNLEAIPLDLVQGKYGSTNFLWSSYLDGASIVLNHADLSSPWIAAICQDLQHTFPHAYANCYITPPGTNSQAVPPHADDRDVLIIQLYGSKTWQVYQTVPIPFPYPHEQVGKDGRPVPPHVLDPNKTIINTTLNAGDVLYMPRGYVHQAMCDKSAMSFHVTIALATHDWTLAGVFSVATEHILSRVVDFRKSVLPIRTQQQQQQQQLYHNGGMNNKNNADLQQNLQAAFKLLQQEITVESVTRNLGQKIDNHNRRSHMIRMNQIHMARFGSTTKYGINSSNVTVGPLASQQVTLDTKVRAATEQERASINMEQHQQQRGINVREEIANDIMQIIGGLKQQQQLQQHALEYCRVGDLAVRYLPANNNYNNNQDCNGICNLTLLSLAKRGVELGALAIEIKTTNTRVCKFF